MCKLLEEMTTESFNKGVEVGEIRGEAKGEIKGTLKTISALMRNQNLTADQAMGYLDIPASDRELYLAKL